MNIKTTVSYLASGLFLLLFSAACVCSPPDGSKPVVDGSKPEQQVQAPTQQGDDGGSVDMGGQEVIVDDGGEEVIVEEGSSVVEGGGEVIVEEKTEYSFQPPGNAPGGSSFGGAYKLQMSSLPSAHVWKYLASFGAEPKDYATYSYVLTRRKGDKYIDLVNYIQESTTSANEMAESIPTEELNIFLIPALSTDDASRKPNYDMSRKLLDVLSARTKFSSDRIGPYIITMYQPISKLKKGAEMDMLYVDLTNINKGAFAEVVQVYKKTVKNKRLNGTDKLYSLRLSLLNLAFMTEESIGFAKTASASLDPVFSGGKK